MNCDSAGMHVYVRESSARESARASRSSNRIVSSSHSLSMTKKGTRLPRRMAENSRPRRSCKRRRSARRLQSVRRRQASLPLSLIAADTAMLHRLRPSLTPHVRAVLFSRIWERQLIKGRMAWWLRRQERRRPFRRRGQKSGARQAAALRAAARALAASAPRASAASLTK